MKAMIVSDIHGDAISTKKIVDVFREEKCDNLIILGDILYHGPRNDLPAGYAPKTVISLLNELSDKVIAIKGNCDAEVDEMVLSFKIIPAYHAMNINGISTVLTHGHKYNIDNPPPSDYKLLLYGHTHVSKISTDDRGRVYINPGSVSIPKEQTPKSYAIFDEKSLQVIDFDKNIVLSYNF